MQKQALKVHYRVAALNSFSEKPFLGTFFFFRTRLVAAFELWKAVSIIRTVIFEFMIRGVFVLPDTFNKNIYFLSYIYSLTPPITNSFRLSKSYFFLEKLDPNIRSFSSEGMFRIASLNFIAVTKKEKHMVSQKFVEE